MEQRVDLREFAAQVAENWKQEWGQVQETLLSVREDLCFVKEELKGLKKKAEELEQRLHVLEMGQETIRKEIRQVYQAVRELRLEVEDTTKVNQLLLRDVYLIKNELKLRCS